MSKWLCRSAAEPLRALFPALLTEASIDAPCGLLFNGEWMITFRLFAIALAVGGAAHADFSYTSTRKMPNMPGAAGDQVTKQYLKGQKMLTEMGSMSILID